MSLGALRWRKIASEFRGKGAQPMRVRFAHRVFHEFFLALALHDDSMLFAGASLPPNVERLLADIRKESLSI